MSTLGPTRARPARLTGTSLHPNPQGFHAEFATHWLLDELDEAMRAQMLERFEIRNLPAFRILLDEGEESSGIFIVLTGRLQADTSSDGRSQKLGEIGAGELIGESSLLMGGARTATVHAIRDSVIAFLPIEAVEALAAEQPNFWRRLAEFVASRAAGKLSSSKSLNITLRPFVTGLDAEWLATSFCEALLPFGSAIVLDSSKGGADSQSQWATILTDAELHYDRVILLADDQDSEWSRYCLRHADHIVFVGDGSKVPNLGDSQRSVDKMINGHLPTAASRRLVLMQPSGISVASGTQAWLAASDVTSHHHIRRGAAGDAHRAARLVAGLGVGVAFSGASSRGAAHSGIVRALRQLHIPVDAVSGSSSGAGATLGLALGESPENILQWYAEMGEALAPNWKRLVPPFVSLMSGKDASDGYRRIFSDLRLEDLLIPVSLVCVDLIRRDVSYLSTGPVWLAARATTSLPGFWPPVSQEGQLLVDGGLADNLPIEVLRSGCGRGLLMGVDLVPSGDEQHPFTAVVPYGDSLSGWKLLWKRITVRAGFGVYPSLFELLFELIVLPNTLRQRGALPGSPPPPDVHFLRPPLKAYGFFDVGSEEGRKLADMAYHYGLEEIAALWRDYPLGPK